MMDSELQEHIRKSALDKQLIRHVQSLLPADDAELDRWLADSLPRQAYNEFVSVICAAILAGRHVDPRHLAPGGLILAAAEILPEVVMRMQQGNVPEYLLQSTSIVGVTARRFRRGRARSICRRGPSEGVSHGDAATHRHRLAPFVAAGPGSNRSGRLDSTPGSGA
jgi:hypothetical protein